MSTSNRYSTEAHSVTMLLAVRAGSRKTHSIAASPRADRQTGSV